MRRRARLNLEPAVTQNPDDKQHQRLACISGETSKSAQVADKLARRQERWRSRNKNKPDDENPFLKLVKPDYSEDGDDLRARLANFEYGNFPGYFNYRKNAAAQSDSNAAKGEQPSETDNNSEQKSATAPPSGPPLDVGLTDERLKLMQADWFKGKDVLDIGCNRGHVTYAIARLFKPNFILGIDIDLRMCQMANRDLHLHIEDCLLPQSIEMRRKRAERLLQESSSADSDCQPIYTEDENHFPLSSYISQGPIALPKCQVESNSKGADNDEAHRNAIGEEEESKEAANIERTEGTEQKLEGQKEEQQQRQPDNADPDHLASNSFANSIVFVEHNYVLASDELVDRQRPFFDTIVCLSVTKWIHLNYRDEGLKRFFKRIYRHLRAGGLLILEAQPFDNYGRRKKLSNRLRLNYQSIEFRPEQFDDYLLGPEVGFSRIIYSTTTEHKCVGFKRPLKVFVK